MHRQSPRGARAVWLLLTTAAIVACTPAPSTDGGSAPPAGRGSTAPTSAGSGAPVVELPAGFPVLAGAVPAALQPTDDPALIARWSTDQVGPVAYDFYVDALPAAGYPTTGLFPGGGAAVIVFRTPRGESWELALTQDDGGARIEVRLAQP
jgi:hypothetical protein